MTTFEYDHRTSAQLSTEYQAAGEAAAEWTKKDPDLLASFAKAFGPAGYARLTQITNYVRDRNYQASQTSKGHVDTGVFFTQASQKVHGVDNASREGFNRIVNELI